MRKPILVALAGLFITVVFPARMTRAQQLSHPPAPPPGTDTLTIPAGTTLRTELSTILSTKTSKNGDPFSARVVESIISNGEEVVPVGSTVEGRVSMIKQPGRVSGIAEMRLIAESITTPDEVKYSVAAGLQDAQGADGAKVKGEEGTIEGNGKSRKGEVIETGIGAGVGAGVGAMSDGGMGSLYGLGIGAAAGVIHSITKKHKDIILPQGTELTFMISRTTTAKKVAEKPADNGAQ